MFMKKTTLLDSTILISPKHIVRKEDSSLEKFHGYQSNCKTFHIVLYCITQIWNLHVHQNICFFAAFSM